MKLERSFRLTPVGWFLLLVLVMLLVWQIPYWETAHLRDYVSPERLQVIVNDVRTTWAQIFGGIGVLGGLYFAYRRLAIADKTAQAAQRNTELEGERQVTDRFTRAIDQLGAERLEIRLGGIYALERIAEDSRRDRWTVFEVLSAHIRENAPAKPREERPDHRKPVEARHAPERRAEDLQSVILVLGRLSSLGGVRPRREWLDLSRTDLRDLSFEGLSFHITSFQYCHLTGGQFQKADVRSSNFTKATISDSSFRHGDMNNATFKAADLSSAVLIDVDANRTSFSRTHMHGAVLSAGSFRAAFFRRAVLQDSQARGADFSDANLRQVRFANSDISKSAFANADMRNINLESSALGGAEFRAADMRNANLRGAFVADADFGGANLSGANLSGLREWQQISDLTGANLHNIKDAPEGFLRWATGEMGAIVSSDGG